MFPLDLVMSRPLHKFTVVLRKRQSKEKLTKDDFECRLELAFGKALSSMSEAQSRYKRSYDKRVLQARKLRVGESVYLYHNHGTSKREKLSREVCDPFCNIFLDRVHNMFTIPPGDVEETVSGNRVALVPASTTPFKPAYAAQTADFQKKNKAGRDYSLKRILDHRADANGDSCFKLDLEDNFTSSLQTRSDVPEEPFSRYLAKRARRSRCTVQAL